MGRIRERNNKRVSVEKFLGLKESQRSMGSAELRSGDNTFVRKFRWTASADHLEDTFVQEFDYDLVKQELRIVGLEVFRSQHRDIPFLEWAVGLLNGDYPDEQLTLTTYDGCGRGLYRYIFGGLEPTSYIGGYNYKDSDVVRPEMYLTYSKCSRRLLFEPKNPDSLKSSRPLVPPISSEGKEPIAIDFLHSRHFIKP